ncbi:O-antigen ligase family protein [Aurantiacibacter flavus]|uniref:O-antigen ligase family protein n=1 Tax=Aurantiacibacter flavus TaxID=3145232 RepID=A0ABV0CYV3_9SPHN
MVAHSAEFGRIGARRPEFQLDRRSSWFDTLIVGAILAAILFNLVLGPLTVIGVFGAVGAFCLLRWERLPGMVLECWPLLLLPAMALASALWSEVPFTTLRYGFLFAITTFAGIIVGAGVRRTSCINGYFFAFATYSVASILFGRWVGWGDGPGDAFAGLAGSKNASGDMAGVATFVTIVFIWVMLKKRRLVAALGVSALLPILAWILISSKATGALIATTLASACLIAWLVSARLAPQARGGIFVASAIIATLALVSQSLWLEPIFDLVLDASGKDAGLTGRSDLWAFGDNLIAERPWLGLGYHAFWLEENVDARYLWDMMGIAGHQGFNFHNTAMEIVIHLGYVGLVLAAIVAATSVAMLVFRSIRAPGFSNILACTLCFFFAVKMPFEVVGFDTMHFATVSIFAALAIGLRRDGAGSLRSARLRPRAIRRRKLA